MSKIYFDYGFGNKGLGCYLWIGNKRVGFIPDIEAILAYNRKNKNKPKVT